ncbi:cilia- and flagella-associated protein 97 [Spea bombifrons]|uniref:cilia- and flagella-associated protein 97 n=1 Tax=Spea bombifrons TaxID=233779 RepID=UPI002348F41C|nr:cilia- and flagella-associated protein 97 [Spea bombifrons]
MDRYGNLLDGGDVDHSFFDSDVDEEAKKGVYSSSGPSRPEYVKKAVEDAEGEQGAGKGDGDRAAGRPSYEREVAVSGFALEAMRPSSAVKSGRSSVQSLKIETTIPTGIPKIRREFEDNYYPDEDDSSEEESYLSRPKSSKQTNLVKKSAGKHSRDLSSSMSSSDTEYSDTGSNDRTSRSSYQSSKERGPSPEKYPGRDLRDYAEESEDTVTDVTPLSTPDISPIQSFDLAATSATLKNKVKRQENISQEIYDPEQKPNPKILEDAMDLNQLLKAFMHLDKKDHQNLAVQHPEMGRRKNYSFTNEEVRHIDRENHRLLKELSRMASKPRGKSLTPPKPSATPVRLYHTALNRQREQQRIERENMALLKRLESVKPTVGITRTEQLMDYQRQAGYLTSTSSRSGRSMSRISSSSSKGGLSRVSSTSSRSDRTGSSAASLRPTKSSNVRAAWL